MSKTQLDMLRAMEPLSVADIERRVGGFHEEYKVVTACLDNRFTLRYGKGKAAKHYVFRYHVGDNKIYPQAVFNTKHEARDYIFEEWAKPRRTIYEERSDYWDEEE
tara:strand:- start:276 stop:593 length:318 start_codon:yes stop_codon:yes gene_type:complete